MVRNEDDATLVARCGTELPGRHDAFETLVERHKGMVYTLCLRMSGNASDAEDLMQEVFTKVFRNLESFEERSAFSSWLYRIAYNHCLNFIGKRRRDREVLAEYTREAKEMGSPRTADTVTDQVQGVLNRLPPDYRAVLILKYVMGLELVEISHVAGVSIGAVKMRLLRAREEFRRAIGEGAAGL